MAEATLPTTRADRSLFLIYEDGPLTLVGEVASTNTRRRDRKKRSETYPVTLQVPEYLVIDLDRESLELCELVEGAYRPLPFDAEGRVWSPRLGTGFCWHEARRMMRVVLPDGQVVPTQQEEAALRKLADERAEQEA